MTDRRRFWVIIGLTLILPVVLGLMLMTGMLWLVLTTPPLVVIEAQTGFVSYRVQRQEVSAMALEGAEVTDVSSFCAAGLDDAGRVFSIVSPQAGATVEYRWIPGMVMIRLSAAPGGQTLVENAKGTQCLASGDLTFLVPAAALDRLPPLPVLGGGQIGAEQGVPTLSNSLPPCADPALAGRGCLNNGAREIAVEPASNPAMRRASARLFGRTSMPFTGGQLYPITDGEFLVPAGGRLEAANDEAPFIGSVTLDNAASTLQVQVTIEADNLRLYRVGQNDQAEILAAGIVARAISDPSLGPALIFVAIIAFMLQVAIGLRGILKDAWGQE